MLIATSRDAVDVEIRGFNMRVDDVAGTLHMWWAVPRVTRYDPIWIWEIDTGYRYGRSDINEIPIGISIWSSWISIWNMG
jgi:hypothetical protein